MSARRLSQAVSCTIFSVFAVGCPLGDPVRTTSQTVRLQVIDSASGKPVAYADVYLKVDFDAAYPLSEETRQPPEYWHKQARQVWKEQPWFRGPTNKDGQVEIQIESTMLDRSSESKPPPERDEVTSLPYLVRVQKDQTPEEQASLVMKSGAYCEGAVLYRNRDRRPATTVR